MTRQLIFAIAMTLCVPAAAFCGEADVVGVAVKTTGSGLYHFDVTVRHDDAGWEHYADKWEVLTPEGLVVGTRILAHPHVGEQPFTRSLSGVKIPTEMSAVTVRVHDSVHAYGGKTVTVELPH